MNEVKHDVKFIRNRSGLIVSLISAFLCIVLAIVIISLLNSWGFDAFAVIILIMCFIWIIAFIYAVILNLNQPSKITITAYNEILIGDNKEFLNISDVKIETYKENLKGGHFFIILFMGLLPGIFLFISLGMYKLIFIHEGRIYTMRYFNDDNYKKLLAMRIADNSDL